jgi:hypothetical protein
LAGIDAVPKRERWAVGFLGGGGVYPGVLLLRVANTGLTGKRVTKSEEECEGFVEKKGVRRSLFLLFCGFPVRVANKGLRGIFVWMEWWGDAGGLTRNVESNTKRI